MMFSSKLLLGAGLVCASGQLFALPLIPGGTVINPASASAPAGTPISVDPISGTSGSLNDGFNWKTGPGQPSKASGNYVNAVYLDPVSNKLDFYYQIQNTFRGSVNGQNTLTSSFVITDFTGFLITDVAQLSSGVSGNYFGAGGAQFKGTTPITITSVTRSANGSNITVNLSAPVRPLQNTTVLLLRTNATNFDQDATGFNWVTAPTGCSAANQALGNCGNAYPQPFFLANLSPVLVPEPGFYGLLSMGVGGLLFAVRRRKAKSIV